MAAVILLPAARRDIERLYGFVAAHNPAAARRAVGAIRQGIRRLKGFSRAGHPLKVGFLYRELYIPFGSGTYVVRYLYDEANTVVVIRVWHSKEIRH